MKNIKIVICIILISITIANKHRLRVKQSNISSEMICRSPPMRIMMKSQNIWIVS